MRDILRNVRKCHLPAFVALSLIIMSTFFGIRVEYDAGFGLEVGVPKVCADTIDAGSPAEDRASDSDIGTNTEILLDNPSNGGDGGSVNWTIEIWSNTNLTDVTVGFVYNTVSTNYTCRSAYNIGAVTAGAKRTFTDVPLSVMTGDYLAIESMGTGNIERSTSGYAGFRYIVHGDVNHLYAGSNYNYDGLAEDSTISVYAYANTPGSPTVITNATVDTTTTTCTASGNITDTGGENADTIYFQWGTVTGTYTDNVTIGGSFSTGNITFPLTGLTLGERYYGRAGAKNGYGTSWGSEVTWLQRITPTVSGNFTIIIFPDTQDFMDTSEEVPWKAMTDWVVDNKDYLNIQAVLGTGDIVNNPYDEDYGYAQYGYDKIKDADILILPIPGNHDYPATDNLSSGNLTKWSEYFGTSYLSGEPYWGGNYTTGNFYLLKTIEGIDYIIIGVETCPMPDEQAWVDTVLALYPDREAIVVSHVLITKGGLLSAHDSEYGADYTLGGVEYGGDTRDGPSMWAEWRDNPQIFFLLAGHEIGPPYTANWSDTNDNGDLVNGLFIDYQDSPGESFEGAIGIMTFRPDDEEIYIQVYSPYTGDFQSDNYTLPYDFGGEGISTPTIVTGSTSNITSSSARISGNVTDTGGENCTVHYYLDTVDHGSNWNDWSINGTVDSPSQPQGVAEFYKDLIGLKASTTYHINFAGNNTAGISGGTSGNFTTDAAVVPTVLLEAITNYGDTWVYPTGNVTDCGGDNVTKIAFQYALAESEGFTDNVTVENDYGLSPFEVSTNITGLIPGTAYKIRFGAFNNAGWGWSEEGEYLFPVSPNVTTLAATLVEERTATLNGNIVSTGGEDVTVKFGWDTDLTTPLANTWESVSTQGTGAFNHPLTGLTPGDKYVVQASANHTWGSGNGTLLYFMTKPDPANSFNATDYSTTNISLEWQLGEGTDWIEIRRTEGSTPPTDNITGTLVYSGNGTSIQDTGLSEGTQYSYRVFTYATEDGTTSEADGSITVTQLTKPEQATGFDDTSQGSSWLFLEWVNGAGAARVEIRYQVGAIAPSDNISGTLGYSGNGTSANVTGLAAGTVHAFRLWTYATADGSTTEADGEVTALGTTSSTPAPSGGDEEDAGRTLIKVVLTVAVAAAVVISVLMFLNNPVAWILAALLGAIIITIINTTL